eukprot:m.291787 g.291787  ORF g.291787 m.291787 type:complete len:69 (-) comp19985_c0_seq5:1317-1523(-)
MAKNAYYAGEEFHQPRMNEFAVNTVCAASNAIHPVVECALPPGSLVGFGRMPSTGTCPPNPMDPSKAW